LEPGQQLTLLAFVLLWPDGERSLAARSRDQHLAQTKVSSGQEFKV